MSRLWKQAFKNPIRAVATVLALLVLLTAFIVAAVAAYLTFWPIPIGDYREVVSTRNYSNERVDLTKTCLKQQWILYRTVGGSVQVRESVLDKARIQCLW